MNKIRLAVGAIAVTGAMLLGIKTHEGFREDAYIPVKTSQGSDVPTIGFGNTKYADGTKVQLGDTIIKVDAEKLLIKTVNDEYARALRTCIKVPLYEYEFASLLSWTYNVGTSAACNSTLVRKLNSYDYQGACKELLKWDKFKGKTLRGLTIRRQQEYAQCMGIKK